MGRRHALIMVVLVMAAEAATPARAATGTVDFLFNETTPGAWDLSASVAGDTSGLAGFAVDIFADPAQVTWTANTLSVITSMDPMTTAGFTTNASGDVGSGAETLTIRQDDGMGRIEALHHPDDPVNPVKELLALPEGSATCHPRRLA